MEEPIDAKETLMFKLIEGTISAEEHALLNSLLKESSDDRDTYKQLEKLWSMSTPMEFNDDIDYAKGWAIIKPKTIGQTAKNRPPVIRSRSNHVRRLRWASSAIGFILIIWLLLPLLSTQESINTEFGETKNVTFADGSMATLHGGTSITYPASFKGDTRTILLEGEAFFDITPSEAPFIVQTQAAEVHVLGTRFNVRTFDGETSVAVQEGHVRLQQRVEPENTLTLKSNEAGVLSADGVITRNDSTGVSEGLDWIGGKLVFTQSTLQDVTEEFKRSMGIEIILTSEIDYTITVSGTFNSTEPSIAIEALCLLAQCVSSYKDGIYYLNAN